MNHVRKDTTELVYVIITMGTNIIGGGTVFYDRVKSSDLVNRAHPPKNLRGRLFFGTFEKYFHYSYPWRGLRAVTYFIL